MSRHDALAPVSAALGCVLLVSCYASHGPRAEADGDAALLDGSARPTSPFECDAGPALPDEMVGTFLLVGPECATARPVLEGPRLGHGDERLNAVLFSAGTCGAAWIGMLDDTMVAGRVRVDGTEYRFVSDESEVPGRGLELTVSITSATRAGRPVLSIEERGATEPWRAWAVADTSFRCE